MTPEQLDGLRDRLKSMQAHMEHIRKLHRNDDFWAGNISGIRSAQEALWHARRASGEEYPVL